MVLGKVVCLNLEVVSGVTVEGDVITLGDGTDTIGDIGDITVVDDVYNLLDQYPFPLKHVCSLPTGIGDGTFGDTREVVEP